jgi:hypothetical protein
MNRVFWLGLAIYLSIAVGAPLLSYGLRGSRECSRCHVLRPPAVEVRCDGKPTIRLCAECAYAQTEAFLKFCPVEDL